MTCTPTTSDHALRHRAGRRVLAALAAAALSATAASSLAVPAAGAAPLAQAATVETRASSPIPLLAVESARALGAASTGASEYPRLRSQLAAAVAAQLGLDAAELSAAWAAADLEHQRALLAALSQVGLAYRRNSSRPGISFDCSGLTMWAWGTAGVSIPRSSARQIRAAAPRDLSTAQAGDLVYYPGHVMMWLGVERAVVHASDPRRGVEVRVIKRSSLRLGDPTGD